MSRRWIKFFFSFFFVKMNFDFNERDMGKFELNNDLNIMRSMWSLPILLFLSIEVVCLIVLLYGLALLCSQIFFIYFFDRIKFIWRVGNVFYLKYCKLSTIIVVHKTGCFSYCFNNDKKKCWNWKIQLTEN